MNLAFDIFPAATPLGTRLVRLTREQLGLGSGFRVELYGLGSGQIVLNRNQPECTSTNFADDNYVQVFDLDISETTPLGGFFLDSRKVKVLSLDEEGGEIVEFGGPGALSYFGRQNWWNTNYVNFGNDAQFGPRADGYWWWYQDQYGDILKRAIDEAQDSDRPAAGRAIPDLTYDFTSTLDSAGAAWDTFDGDYSIAVGTNYLDMVQRLRDLGITVQMTGELLLQAFQGFYGTDRTTASFAADKVLFINEDGGPAEMANIVEELQRQSKPSLKLSRVLVKGDLVAPTSMVVRSAAGYNVPREGFVTTDRTHSVNLLESLGDQTLQLRSDSADVPVFRHLPGLNPLTGRYSPFPPSAILGAYPSIITTADDEGISSDNTVLLPSGIQAGDLLVAVMWNEFGGANRFTFPAGWTELGEIASGGNDEVLGAGYRFADGTEGATANIDSVDAWRSHVMRITGHGGPSEPPEWTTASGIGSSADPPNHTPTGGSQDILWIEAAVSTGNINSWPSASYTSTYYHTPTGYDGGVAYRQLTAASENPGTVPLDGTRSWATATISIRPGPVAEGDYTYWVGDLCTLHTGSEMADYTYQDLRCYAINWRLLKSAAPGNNGEWWPEPELGGLISGVQPGQITPPPIISGGGGGGGGGGVVSTTPDPPSKLKKLLTNKSGGAVVHGDVVVIDPDNDEAFETTTVAGETRLAGVAQGDIPDNGVGYVAIAGYVEYVNVTASVTRGHYGSTSTTVKKAVGAAARAPGAFCQFVKGGTSPSAILFGPPDAPYPVLSWKAPVRAATTAAGTLATSFENGDTIDGVVLATGDRILIKDQAAGEENGIYTVNASGAPTRATDFDLGAEALGAAVIITEGTANADKAFICTTNAPITIGTTALAFAALSGGASLTVEESDGSPSVSSVDKIKFAGLTVTDQGGGDVLVSLPDGTSAKASATADLTPTTSTAQDVTGATLSLAAGTYIVVGVFDVTVNNALNDRLFEGVLDVGGTDENDLAVLAEPSLANVRTHLVQVWRVVLGSTTTAKLQARHSAGTTGDFTVNAANTTLTAFRVGAGSVGSYDIERRSAGDLAITSTTAGDAVPTLGNLIVAAAAGDPLEVGLMTRVGDSDAQSLRLDVATIVSAAVVNYFSSLTGTAHALGCTGWFAAASEANNISGSMLYVVQAGDVSGGNIELSLRAWLSGAGSRPLVASTTGGELQFWVRNHRQ